MFDVDFINNPELLSKNHKRSLLTPEILKDESKLLKWLQDEVQYRESICSDFKKDCFRHLRAYKGEYFKRPGIQTDSNEIFPIGKFTSKYFVNKIFSNTEHFVSRMTRIKPSVDVMPATDEYEDKLATRDVTMLVRHLENINKIDELMQKLHRYRIIFGEAYLHIKFNPDIGDLHPDYVSLKEDNKHEEIKKRLKKNLPIRIGEVEPEVIMPWNVLLDHACSYNKQELVILKEFMHEDRLRLEYPGYVKQSNKKFTSTIDDILSDSSNNPNTNSNNQYVIYHVYVSKSDLHPEGLHIISSPQAIISQTELLSSLNFEPILRISDIDIPEQTRGVSRYTQILSLQNAHNNLGETILRSEFLFGSPKIMVPKGSAKISDLLDGRVAVTYMGAKAPELTQMNPTSPNTLNLRSIIGNELDAEFGIHPVSTGAPPTGITAAVALQFLNEQELERSTTDIQKHNNFIIDLYKHMVAVAADNYQPDDGRVMRVFGKNNKHIVHYLETANLSKNYDFRIQNGTALPQSKPAQMERIIQTMQYGMHLLPPEQWIDLLQLGNADKMTTVITEAVTTAESELEDLMNGLEVAEPKEWEDHITKLAIFYKRIQSRSFKEDVPPKFRENVKEHIQVTEMLANDKAQINPAFAARLAQLELYPMFLEGVLPPPSAQQQEAIANGQTNRGEPVTAQIPAQPLTL